MFVGWLRSLLRRPGLTAYTDTVVTGSVEDPGLLGWMGRDRSSRSPGGTATRWVMRQQLHDRLDPDAGIAARREPSRLEPWRACTATSEPEALGVVLEVELRDVVADLRRPGALRGSAANLVRAWLRPAEASCGQCGAPFTLASISGIDGEYLAWTCQRTERFADIASLSEALGQRFEIPVHTGSPIPRR